MFRRESGILLHPTSLPGRYGIGEAGPEACRFAEVLADMGQHLWQVLPLGPTGYGDSPYQTLSTFAANHMLISFQWLVDEGLAEAQWLDELGPFSPHEVEYERVVSARMGLLERVCAEFARRAGPGMLHDYRGFVAAHEGQWLGEYALFAAIKDAHGGRPWVEWDPALAVREAAALRRARHRLAAAMEAVRIRQFLSARHWLRVRARCREKQVRIIGDLPIFVAHDSADVWAHSELFELDAQGKPIRVAGVPPDYFSASGQRWGNPLYRWDRMRQDGFEWWKRRLRHTFALVDMVRIDHFRGFEAYWAVPAGEPDAVNGQWVPGPGEALFNELMREFGELPVIAEDLGYITPEVEALRDKYGLPGMRILQFAFGTDPKAPDYRPEGHARHCVCYTGTHDNDTTAGWFHSEAGQGSTRTQAEVEAERANVLDYLGSDGSEIHWDLIGLAMGSVAEMVLIPLQDVLGLGSRARMNLPGRATGNWRWRFSWDMLTPPMVRRLRRLTAQTDRLHRG